MHASTPATHPQPRARHPLELSCSGSSPPSCQHLCSEHHLQALPSPRRLRLARRAIGGEHRRSAGNLCTCRAEAAESATVVMMPTARSLRIPVAGSEVRIEHPLPLPPPASLVSSLPHSDDGTGLLRRADSVGDRRNRAVSWRRCNGEARRDGAPCVPFNPGASFAHSLVPKFSATSPMYPY